MRTHTRTVCRCSSMARPLIRFQPKAAQKLSKIEHFQSLVINVVSTFTRFQGIRSSTHINTCMDRTLSTVHCAFDDVRCADVLRLFKHHVSCKCFSWHERKEWRHLGHSFFCFSLTRASCMWPTGEKNNEKNTLSTRGYSVWVPLNTRGALHARHTAKNTH